MKEKIINWFNLGLWTADMVKNACIKGILTESETNEIIGEVANG